MTILTSRELTELLGKCGVETSGLYCADEKYALATPKSLLQAAEAGLDLLRTLHAAEWVKEKNDCDDFAAFISAHLRLSHHRMGGNGSALAVGEFWYRMERGGAHAIVAMACRTDAGNVVRFVEPQTAKWLDLSVAERGSCLFARF